MKGSFAKQVITGIAGLVFTIGLFVLSQNAIHISNTIVNDFVMVVAFGSCFGFLLYIFGNTFFDGFKYGAGLTLFIVLTTQLPGKWAGIFIILCVAGFWVYPTVQGYIYDRELNSPTPRNKKVAKKIKEYEELEQMMESENEEFLNSIGFGERSLILRTISGSFYQLIKGADKYYFVYTGNEISGLDSDELKTDFSDENTYKTKKKDFSIARSDVTSIVYKTNRLKNVDFENSGSIVIYNNGNRKSFQVMDNISVDEMEKFFEGIKFSVKQKNQSSLAESLPIKNIDDEFDSSFIKRMKLVFTVLTAASMLIGASFLFLDFNYKLMSVLCMMLFAAFFILYIKYDKLFSLEDEQDAPVFTKDKINLSYSIFLPCFALGLRSMLDFNIISYRMFWIFTGIVFLAIMFMFFMFSDEYKRKKSAIGLIIIAALFFAPSSVIQMNYVFDNSPESLTRSEIYSMRISEGSKAPDDYLLEVDISTGQKMEMKVSKEYYESVSVGDKVLVVEKEGFLNIPYAYINEK